MANAAMESFRTRSCKIHFPCCAIQCHSHLHTCLDRFLFQEKSMQDEKYRREKFFLVKKVKWDCLILHREFPQHLLFSAGLDENAVHNKVIAMFLARK